MAESSFDSYLFQQGLLTESNYETLKKSLAQKPIDDLGNNPQALARKIADRLISDSILTEEEATRSLAAFFGLPYVDLRKLQIPSTIKDMIPKESQAFYNITPFELSGSVLKVALADPSNLQVMQALEFIGTKQNLQIEIYLASSASLAVGTGQKMQMFDVVGQALEVIKKKEEDEKPVSSKEQQERSKDVMQDAPIIKIVDVILSNALEANASDIHIEPSENEVRVRYRIDGLLHNSLVLPRNVHSAVVTRIKILTNLKIDEHRLPQDGRFHFEAGGKSVDLRVSLLPLIYGEKVVMRLLDKTTSAPTLDQLGIVNRNQKTLLAEIKKTHGIFLITGPTGSGKSTTLYAVLSMINTDAVNIVTLEDPVEYFIQGVNQSQIHAEIGLTFAAGLRSILRQDPNIVMVGEVRDVETAELAVHAALTGHLVFSTLHTNNALGAMPRLIDMGIEPFLLAASINVVAAQRLVRKLCTYCKGPSDAVSPAMKDEIRKQLAGVPKEELGKIDMEKLDVFKGAGCDRCEHTGYRGRIGIYEIFPITKELQDMVLKHVGLPDMYEYIAKQGYITLKQDGLVKALLGETSIDEIIRVTTE